MDRNFYASEWTKVDSALAKGLPKSALAIVEKIFVRAHAEKNDQQIIKSVAYRVALRAEAGDEQEKVLVADLLTEIAGAGQPVRAVLQSILAELYWRYYQENRWEIRGRTKLADKPADDFRTWDVSAFFDTTAALYLASLEPSAELLAMPVSRFGEILIPGNESGLLRPTLFDVLAHRALAFFSSEESDLPEPVKAFELNSLDALREGGEFCAVLFQSPDERDPVFLSVRLYQQLLSHLLGTTNIDAIVDLDLMRLAFMRNKTMHEEKDTAYYKALGKLLDNHAQHESASRILFAMAQYHFDDGDYVKAMEICERGMTRAPRSAGGRDCAALKSRILEKNLTVSVEETVAPDASVQIATGFRNVGAAWYRVYELDVAWENWLGSYDEKLARLKNLLRNKPIKQWMQALPATTDYKEHLADVTGPAMPQGRYLLLASPREDFALDHGAVVYTRLTVTRLSLQSQTRANGDIVFRVHDAASGEPIQGAVITLTTSRYDYKTSQYRHEQVGEITTTADGSALHSARNDREAVSAKVTYKGEVLLPAGSFYSYERDPDNSTHMRTMLFTDRSIYRPGQTIYFKGIVMQANNALQTYKAAARQKVTVEFFDANYQKITSLALVTNEFGSYQGTFTAPSGVLTGRMTIRDPWGNAVVRVEEYKRPKFEVEFLPVTGSFSLGDTIRTSGVAKAYAGSNIDGAKVAWRVVRQARYPYWRWWWMPMPASPEKEIAHGTTTTSDKGGYEIAFEALPDRSIAKAELPVFTYTIHADVTDVNGETHSATSSISVGYTAIELSLNIPESMELGAATPGIISAVNLGGEPLKARGDVTLELLKGPARIMRTRTLAASDMATMTEAEFIAAFPFDVYKHEDRREQWPAAASIQRPGFVTDATGRDTLDLGGLAAGVYRVTLATRDDKGNDIHVTRFFTIHDSSVPTPTTTTPMLCTPIAASCEPGELATFRWSTSYRGARLLYQVEHRGVIIKEEWLTLNNEVREFSIPILEEHRGGITVHLSMVRNYRWYHESISMYVPWTNKELHVETATFRDKLQPGQSEEWRITIRGSKREAVAAELVASMYDASLDAIYREGWPNFAWPLNYSSLRSAAHTFGISPGSILQDEWNVIGAYSWRGYPTLNLFLLGRSYRRYYAEGGMGGDMMMKSAMPTPAPMAVRESMNDMALARPGVTTAAEDEDAGGVSPAAQAEVAPEPGLGQVKARTNFNETAFFFPQLVTNDKGEVVLKFTMPEALTRWRLTAFAHTADMRTGSLEKTTVTQKDLMVMPNAPRFLREGDRIVFPIKITNMVDSALKGTARLMLFDAETMKPIDARFGLTSADQPFTVEKQLSTSVQWSLTVPDGVSAIVYRVVAKAGAVSDGEEAPLPVLPNRMLVTETLPLNVRGNETRNYTFDKLVASGSSTTLRHQRLTLEMTSNPAWYAVQALPYLMEFPYECSEQVFNRLYANSIASHLVHSSPKIQRIFEQWKNTEALASNLEKNQELKSLLLQETPWVMQAQNEGERKKRIGLLFDLNTMSNSLASALNKLDKAQGGNGGWPWFPGMPESRYITQYILAGFGHLRELGVSMDDPKVQSMVERAVAYVDVHMNSDYLEMKRQPGFDPSKDHLGHVELQYLYARTFFPAIKRPRECDEAAAYWIDQAKKYWLSRNLLSQGMIALALHRVGDKATPSAILRSLTERALHSDEMGMYWKQDGGWFWWQAPIETQALLIEAYDEVANDRNSVEEMKIWLLKQKQVQDWKTTVATAEACYALLHRGSDLLASDRLVEASLGGKRVDPRARDDVKVEAGTGHYKVAWSGGEIRPDMGRITVTKRDSGIAWGALFWQYYEQLDKITFAKSPLWIAKNIFRQNATDKGLVLESITEQSPLHVGDILKVRIEIRCDRDMEYIHLKDMRGAGLELINQLSAYRWQGGLGYYEAPKDASVNFFIYWLPKGVYVFEYDLRVSHEGVFSNGISTIQSMYAPEFAGHTAGITIKVAGK